MGASYLALAPQHPIVQQAAANDPALAKFCDDISVTKVAEADWPRWKSSAWTRA